MVLHKTCFYSTIYPMRAGAIVGSWGRADLRLLTGLAFLIGAAFQIQDDVLSLSAHAPQFGKDRYGDLKERKRSLPMIHLLGCLEGDDAELVRRLLTGPASQNEADLNSVVDLLHAHRSLEAASQLARALSAEARTLFPRCFAGAEQSDDLHFIDALVDFVAARTW
jgi:geranylgeranyl diphosphate synthase type II